MRLLTLSGVSVLILFAAACAPARSGRLAPGVQYAVSTAEGGVVQAESEAAADAQMRERCPGGYEIARLETVASVTPAEGRARRFTFRCMSYGIPAPHAPAAGSSST